MAPVPLSFLPLIGGIPDSFWFFSLVTLGKSNRFLHGSKEQVYYVGQTFSNRLIRVHFDSEGGEDRESGNFPARPAELAWCIHFDSECKLQLFSLGRMILCLLTNVALSTKMWKHVVLGLTSLIQQQI